MKIEKIFKILEMDSSKFVDEKDFENYKKNILQQKDEKITAVDRVFLARYKRRPKGIDFIENLIDNPIYLHGDRYFSDDNAIVCGIGKLDKEIVTFIAINKGREINENVKCNFGMVHPEGYRKAVRIMKQAEKFNRPIIIFIDTPGAYPGVGAEERGQAEALANSIYEMTKLNTRIISVVVGEGASGGAIALSVSDYLMMMENAIYSVLSPEGFASILWRDSSRADEAKEMMKLTSYDLMKFGIIDEVVKEELAFEKKDFKINYDRLKISLINKLEDLKQINIKDLLKSRRDRFGNLTWD